MVQGGGVFFEKNFRCVFVCVAIAGNPMGIGGWIDLEFQPGSFCENHNLRVNMFRIVPRSQNNWPANRKEKLIPLVF